MTGTNDNSRCLAGNDCCTTNPVTLNMRSEDNQGTSPEEDDKKKLDHEEEEQPPAEELQHHHGGVSSIQGVTPPPPPSPGPSASVHTEARVVSMYSIESDPTWSDDRGADTRARRTGGDFQHCLALVTEALRVVEGKTHSYFEDDDSSTTSTFATANTLSFDYHHDFEVVFERTLRQFQSDMMRQQQPHSKAFQ